MLPIKVNQLAGPIISGAVSVPLAELDKMRADHANAIKLAATLEEQQKGIVITLRQNVLENRCIADYLYPGIDGATGKHRTPQRFESFQSMEDIEIAYKNMDEVLATLKLDATAIVQTEIDATLAAREKSDIAAVKAKKDLSDANKKHTKAIGKLDLELQELQDENFDLIEAKAVTIKEFDDISDNYISLTATHETDNLLIEEYEQKIYDLENKLKKKSIFSWWFY
jgi:hypothetical protein